MRTVLAALVCLTACSQRSAPEEETGVFDPADAVRTTGDAIRVEVHRRDVPLAEMPIIAHSLAGLPMSGMANIAIDITVPKTGGVAHYRQATGTIELACPAGCKLGDGRSKLQFGGLGDVDFGWVAFDAVDIKAELKNGVAEITAWNTPSKDIDLHAKLKIDLADGDLDASTLDGCLAFKETPALLAAQPKTAAVIATTGASVNRDGLYTIKLSGTLGASRRLAQDCAAQ